MARVLSGKVLSDAHTAGFPHPFIHSFHWHLFIECLRPVQPCSGPREKSGEQNRNIPALPELAFYWAESDDPKGESYVSWQAVGSAKQNEVAR